MSNIAGGAKDWKIVSFRVHPEDYKKLKDKHSDGKDVSRVLRALVNMYVNGRIENKIQGIFVDNIT